ARQRLFGARRARRAPRPKKPQATPRPGRCKQMFASLSDYLDGVLDDSMCEQMEKHMAGCQPCEAFIATLKTAVEQVKGYSTDGLDAHATAELRRSLLTQYAAALEGVARARTDSRR